MSANKEILIHPYIFPLSWCLPNTWFITTIVFLQFQTSVRNSLDTQPSEDTITNKQGLINNQSNNEPVHVVHDNREQVIDPVIDDERIDLNGPGEMGKPVEINKTDLLPSELQKYEDGFEKNAFDAYVSDLISEHRSLSDVRDSGCRKIESKAPLVTASIVMCFHNEAWSELLRSVHSIIDRSPSHLLKEIILVDDFSDMDHLKKPLNDYVKLDPISQNDINVLTPLINVIDDTTLKFNFSAASSISFGGFDWSLQFNWHPLPERERQRRKHHLEPVRSPTMTGGLFAISKRYFNDLGTYDAGMDMSGGENLKISFRIWICEGTLLTTPCSHVGHIFRKRSPYKWLLGVNVVEKNNVRVAEVWLDEYKKYYYERFNYNLCDYGDVTSRKLLRQKLQCKSFKWYLTEIYPELFIPDNIIASGEIRSFGPNSCVDGSTDRKNHHKPVIGYSCHNQDGNQFFMLSSAGEIRRDEGCLHYAGEIKDANKDDTVIVLLCHGKKGNQHWIYNENSQLYHPNSNLCMILSEENKHIRMQTCDLNNMPHRWSWKRKPSNTTNAA